MKDVHTTAGMKGGKLHLHLESLPLMIYEFMEGFKKKLKYKILHALPYSI